MLGKTNGIIKNNLNIPQEVYYINFEDEPFNIYNGLKNAWQQGIRSYIAGFMIDMPASVAPNDEELSEFMVMFNSIQPSPTSNPKDVVYSYMYLITENEITEYYSNTTVINDTHIIRPESETATQDLIMAYQMGIRSFMFITVGADGEITKPCSVIPSGNRFLICVHDAVTDPNSIDIIYYYSADDNVGELNMYTQFNILSTPFLSYEKQLQIKSNYTIMPSIMYVWEEIDNLNITLGEPEIGRASEYIFQFASGTTPTTLSLPSDIKWVNGEAPTIEANTTYQISIINNLGICVAFK